MNLHQVLPVREVPQSERTPIGTLGLIVRYVCKQVSIVRTITFSSRIPANGCPQYVSCAIFPGHSSRKIR